MGEQVTNLEIFDDFGSSTYRGMRLAATRRSATGVSISGNYTWSYCFGNTMVENQNQFAAGPTKPDDLTFDRGNCRQNKTHIGNLTLGYQTPQLGGRALGAIASDWRVSGIFTASSGSWLTVFTGRDTALNGQVGAPAQGSGQRVNQISGDVYGAKTLDSYVSRAAFAEPAPGEFGNHVRNSIAGPGQWNIDLAVSRLLSMGGARTLELRLEAFNLTNHFNWGLPQTNFLAGTFGRITTQATPPRIMQFGVKYGF